MSILPIQNRINTISFKRLGRSGGEFKKQDEPERRNSTTNRGSALPYKSTYTPSNFYAHLNDIIMEKNLEGLKEIIARSRGVNEPIYYEKWRILHYIAKENWVEAYEYLKNNFDLDINVQKNDGWTPLHLAANGGRIDMVKALLKNKDIDLTIKNEFNKTAKDLAVDKGYTEIVKLIEQAKADKNKVNTPPQAASDKPKRGFTKDEGWQFEDVCKNRDLSQLKKLITSEIDIDTEVGTLLSRQTIFQDIACFGWVEGYEYLRDNFDFDVNIQDRDGWTALHYAASGNKIDMVKALLANKDIDSSIKSINGFTAKDMADRYYYTEIVNLIEQAETERANNSNKRALNHYEKILLEDACFKKELPLLKNIITPDIDINAKMHDSKRKDSIIHYIARQGWVKGYEYLNNNFDLNVNAQTDNGATPLHIAIICNHKDFIQALLKRDDLDITIKDKYGRTAKDEAVARRHDFILKIFDEYEKTKTVSTYVDKLTAKDTDYSIEQVTDYFKTLITQKKYDKAIEILEKPLQLNCNDKRLVEKVNNSSNDELKESFAEYKTKQQAEIKNFFENEITKLNYEELKNNQIVLNTFDGFKYLINNEEFYPNDIIENKSLFEYLCKVDTDGELVKQVLSKFDDVFTEKVKSTTQNRKIKTLIEEYETVGKSKIKLDKIKRLLINPITREIGINQIKDIIDSNSFNPELSDSIGNSVLHIVSTIPDDCARSLIQKVIDKGVNINSKNIAQQNSLVGVIKSLIISKNEDEKTSLLSNIKFLLDKGINIDEQDKLGQTAFHYVCFTTSVALLTLFLSKTPNVFIKDIKGNRASKYLKTDEMKKIYENYLRL